jgi:hypothetical protein
MRAQVASEHEDDDSEGWEGEWPRGGATPPPRRWTLQSCVAVTGALAFLALVWGGLAASGHAIGGLRAEAAGPGAPASGAGAGAGAGAGSRRSRLFEVGEDVKRAARLYSFAQGAAGLPEPESPNPAAADVSRLWETGVFWVLKYTGAVLVAGWEDAGVGSLVAGRSYALSVVNLGAALNESDLAMVAFVEGESTHDSESRAFHGRPVGPGEWRFDVSVSRPGRYTVTVRVIEWRGWADPFTWVPPDDSAEAPRVKLRGKLLGSKGRARFYDFDGCHFACLRLANCAGSSLRVESKHDNDDGRRCFLFERVDGTDAAVDGEEWRSTIVPAAWMGGSLMRWNRSVSLSSAMNFADTQGDLPAHVDKVFGTPLAFTAEAGAVAGTGEGGADAAPAPAGRAARPQCTQIRQSHDTWVWFNCSKFERPDPRCYEPTEARPWARRAIRPRTKVELLWNEPAECEYKVFPPDLAQACLERAGISHVVMVGDSIPEGWTMVLRENYQNIHIAAAGELSDGVKDGTINRTAMLIWNWRLMHKLWHLDRRSDLRESWRDEMKTVSMLSNQLPRWRFFLTSMPLVGEREPKVNFGVSIWASEMMRPDLLRHKFSLVDLNVIGLPMEFTATFYTDGMHPVELMNWVLWNMVLNTICAAP